MIQWEKLYWLKIFLKLLKVEEDFFLGGVHHARAVCNNNGEL